MRHGKSVITAVFGPDSRQVVTASADVSAQVWEAATGKAVGEPFRHQANVNSAVFSPDGWRVVTASDDGTAQVLEAAGKAVSEPLRHQGGVKSAVFSRDGRQVVTASSDGTARVWEVLAGFPLASARLAELAEVVGGYRLVGTHDPLEDGGARSASGRTWSGLTGTLERFEDRAEHTRDLRANPGDALTKWLLADPWTRAISPSSSVPITEYIRGILGQGGPKSIDPEFANHPLLGSSGR